MIIPETLSLHSSCLRDIPVIKIPAQAMAMMQNVTVWRYVLINNQSQSSLPTIQTSWLTRDSIISCIALSIIFIVTLIVLTVSFNRYSEEQPLPLEESPLKRLSL